MKSAAAPRSAWVTLALLSALMAIDFADRQILIAAFPYLRRDWGLSEAQLGGMVSVLNATVALATLPIAVLVDRWSRVRAVAWMGTVWSLATVASGLAQNYVQLLAARIVVGAGEAGYGPAGAALLATAYPPDRRASVLGAFQAAAPVGTVLGMAVGSAVAAEWGWRWAFGLLALPGLILALFVLRQPDYPSVGPERAGARGAVEGLLRARSALCAVAGGTLLLIVYSALYTWLPTHLEQSLGISPARAGGLAATALLAGAVGCAGGAVVADRLTRRDARARLTVPAAAAAAAAVLLAGAFGAVPPGAVQLALVVVGTAAVSSAVGPVMAVVIDVVHPGLRATATSLAVLVLNLCGLAVGPVLTGLLSDRFGLVPALTAVSALGVAASAALWQGSRRYPRDRAAAALGGAVTSPGSAASAPRTRPRSARPAP